MIDLSKHKRIVSEKAINECKKEGVCFICKYPGNDPHHIITRGSGGPDHKYNLICLCRKCHRNVHDGLISRKCLFELQSLKYGINIDENTIYDIMYGVL